MEKKKAKRYATLSVSSGIRKNYKLEYIGKKDVSLKSVSDITSELEISFPDKTKVRVLNLDTADKVVREYFGDKVPKRLQGYDKLGKYKGERFVSLHEAFNADTPFEEYLAKAE